MEKHRCQPPVDTSCCGPGLLHATEPRGTLWQCGCGKLWRVGLDIQFGDAWFRAGWLARRRYQRQVAAPQAPDPAENAEDTPGPDLAEETLGRLAGNGPRAAELYQSYMEGKRRRDREAPEDLHPRAEPSPLHAHKITPDDAALIRMMSGAHFGDAATVVMPSGKTITGAEMRRWVDSQGR